MGQRQIRERRYPVALTCLQWDRDGALNDDDRDLLLRSLAVHEPVRHEPLIGAVSRWSWRHNL